MTWNAAAPAVSAAFLGSFVEAVEAWTILLAVATVRGWRPAGLSRDTPPRSSTHSIARSTPLSSIRTSRSVSQILLPRRCR
jgi:hypothetical protein